MKWVVRGFTMVELLVSMAVITIIVGFTVAGFQNHARYQQYDQDVALVRTTIADVKADARVSEGGTSHGVRVFSNQLVLFVGSSYTVGDPNNRTVPLSHVTLVPTLTGGATEVVFSQLTGLPSATGTITVTGVSYSGSQTIEITDAGVIQ